MRCSVLMAATAPLLLAGIVHGQELTPVEILEARGRIAELTQRGQPDSALIVLRQIVKRDSADAYLWRQYGRLAAQQKRWPEAAGALEHAFALGVFNRANTALEIARIHLAAGQQTKALDWIERAAANRLQQPQRFIMDTAFAMLRDSARLRAIYPVADAGDLSRDEKWRRDIDFFAREAQRMHVHPERPAHSRAFVDSVAALKRRIPASSDASVKLGLRRLVAMLKDGHSGMQRDSTMRLLPVDLYWFSDGVFVVSGIGDAARYVGRRVINIGGRPVSEVARAVSGFITRDNDMDLRARLPAALINTSFLSEIGIAKADGTVDVTLEDEGGRRDVVNMAGGPLRSSSGLWAETKAPRPFYLDRSRPYWTRDVPEAKALYLNFNAVREIDSLSLGAFSQRLAAQLRDSAYKNLIVDIRANGGGNTFLLPPLIQAIASFAAVDTARRIYVITSRHTFSAAQNFAGKLEWLLDPVFVGEPTGSSPNFTGESTATVLPYSGLQVGISNRMHMNSDWEDQRSWIAPDLPVALSSADFFAGRDPALAAIIGVAN